jgi:hypothetical protein
MTEDALFAHIEKLQGARPWGSVLDAGTGRDSIRWITGLPSSRWTAVTADPERAQAMRRELAQAMRPEDRVLAGNWADPAFLHGEVHDTVLADYLLGALDYFAPYFQEQLFGRLRPLVGSRLYVIGLEPFAERSDDPGEQAIIDVVKLRDACILLAGDRPYREFPLAWALRSLERSGFQIEDATSFTIIQGARWVDEQLDCAAGKLACLEDAWLGRALGRHIEVVRERALRLCERPGGVHFGEDYVVEARPE